MTTRRIAQYYEGTADRAIREDLRCAVDLVGDPGVAIDCGCGAGADIVFLLDRGFTVHAFDVEPDAISRCHARFGGDPRVQLSLASFSTFEYPSASLVTADASLFFCPPAEFDRAWCRISTALIPGGIFSGSFLGPKDTMAQPGYRKDALWPDVLVVTEETLRPRFAAFDVERWTEHQVSGKEADGSPHDWHIFSVVAKKQPHA